jgi:hypothetical protein
MGLTIHYSLKAGHISTDDARALVRQLRAAALDLPFDEVGEIVELPEGSRFPAKSEVAQDARLLALRAARPIILTVDGQEHGEFVSPTEMIAFVASPAEGSEAACFGLAQYPSTVIIDDKCVPTDLDGWRWWAFCKTQYASNPSLGGIKQFLRCHLGIVAMLDKAKEIGILDEVHDEGGYWGKRDVAALVKEIGRWNAMVAGAVGQLQDQLEAAGRDRRSMISAITEFPDFERLEAEGRAGEAES